MKKELQSDRYIQTESGRYDLTMYDSWIDDSTLDLSNLLKGDVRKIKGISKILIEVLKRHPEVDRLKLRSLEKISNQNEIMTVLAEVINSTQTLRTLKISIKKIDDESMKTLAEALKANASLKHLHLDENLIGAEGAQVLAEALKENKSLEDLSLNQNQVCAEGAQALAESLKENASLKHLHLGENQIGDEGAKALAEALKTNASLECLNLEKNQIGHEGVQVFAEALTKNSNLGRLNFDDNQIGAERAQALAESLKENARLESLILNDNQIGPEGAQALAEALKENARLKYLYLSRNQIGDEGAQALAEALKENASLERLILGINEIGDEGAQALAEALKTNASLKHLYLGDNQIGDEGAQALAEALKENTSLEQLILGINEIGDEGAQALAEVLKKNLSLKILSLRHNQIGDEGAKALAEALKENASLERLGFDGNQIGDEGVNALTKMMRVNFRLTYVEGFRNPSVSSYLERNNKLKSYIDLLIALRKCAVDKGLSSEKENELKTYLKKWNKNFFKDKDENTWSSKCDDFINLSRLIENELKQKLNPEELEQLNQYGPGISASLALFEVWKAEEALLEGENKEKRVTVRSAIDELISKIPDGHSLRGEAHARAADLLTQKINELSLKSAEEKFSRSEFDEVFEFLSHCENARILGLEKTRYPVNVEEQVLKCLLNYFHGKGWKSDSNQEDNSNNNNNLLSLINKSILSWNSSRRGLKSPDLNIVELDVRSIGSDSNDEDVEVVILNHFNELNEEERRVFSEEVIKQYPNAVVVDDTLSSLFERSPLADFINSEKERKCPAMERFYKKIQEIQVCGSSIGVQKRFDELIALYNKLCNTEGEFKALHNARSSWCSHNPDLRLTNNAQSADFIKALGMIKDALLDNVRQMPDENLKERQEKIKMIEKTKESAAIKHRRGNFVFFTTGFSPMSSYTKLEKMESELRRIQMKNRGDTNVDKLR